MVISLNFACQPVDVALAAERDLASSQRARLKRKASQPSASFLDAAENAKIHTSKE